MKSVWNCVFVMFHQVTNQPVRFDQPSDQPNKQLPTVKGHVPREGNQLQAYDYLHQLNSAYQISMQRESSELSNLFIENTIFSIQYPLLTNFWRYHWGNGRWRHEYMNTRRNGRKGAVVKLKLKEVGWWGWPGQLYCQQEEIMED